ncbi:diguanylate cyclase [Crenobacter luteus]|nr:diguanylate cyclase [Crenobacter luteus]
MARPVSFLFRLLLLFALAAVARAAPPAAPDAATRVLDLANHVDVLVDAQRAFSLAEVAAPSNAARFAPVAARDEDINFGYRRGAYWLRVVVAPASDGRWLLEVGFPSLDRVDVFLPDRGEAYRMGDTLPFAQRPLPNRNFLVPLDTRAGQTRTVYLRVESEGSLTVPLRLWEPEAFRDHNQRQYTLFALYYGMLLALGLYNLLLFLSLRDRLYLVYVAFAASMAVGQLSLNGLGNQYLWPTFPAWGNVALNSGFAATGFFGALFTRLFLATRRHTPRLDALIVVLAAGFAAAALGPAVMPYQWAAICTSLLGAGFAAVAEIAAIRCLVKKQPGARYFLLAWTLLLAGVALMAFRNLGWVPTNALTHHAMQVGSALEMLLLSFALADRIQSAQRDKAAAQAEAIASKEAMLAALRQSEQTLEARVAERTKELERANARLIASENKLSHLAHHDPLTGLANRLLLHERLASALLRAQRGDSRLGVLLIDLDGFKPINDRFGHDAGDRLLVAVAGALRAAVRDTDTVARLGGDEFVVLLETLHRPEDAGRVADKLLAGLRRVSRALDGPLPISASIGIAVYPEHGTDAHTLLLQADAAMYRAKRAGRDRWCHQH